MMASRAGLVAVLTAFVVLGLRAGASNPQGPGNTVPGAQPLNSHQWLGTASCAAMGCHNANGLKGEWRSEYTTWASHDPHARAYEVLFQPRSRSIVKNLRLGTAKLPHELALCLNCHVHGDFEKADHHGRFTREDGVGCESCHGPAGNWVSEHYKPHWIGLTTAQRLDKGMWDTRSLTGRVRTCTPCHVGVPGMEVNHDLIAAGHPRLAFEFSAYHALAPHHWQDAKDKQPGSSTRARTDWDAAAWFVGEALTAQAAMHLLAARASDKALPWPEFADYDCYACHHQLQNKNWRQERDFGKRKPGTLPWNDWYASPLAYRLHPGKNDAEMLLGQIATLKAIMEKSPTPDRSAVRQQAQAVAQALEAWAGKFEAARYGSKDVAGFVRQIAEQGARKSAGSWDDATQRYLALAALYHAWRAGAEAAPPDLREPLRGLRQILLFPPAVDSPQPAFTPVLLVDQYKLLNKRLTP
jgi:hypothetical protein